MTRKAPKPDFDWIVPDRAYAPGHEPPPRAPAAADPAERSLFLQDLWRGAAILLVICAGVMAFSAVIA